jgi:hypothetical protein
MINHGQKPWFHEVMKLFSNPVRIAEKASSLQPGRVVPADGTHGFLRASTRSSM